MNEYPSAAIQREQLLLDIDKPSKVMTNPPIKTMNFGPKSHNGKKINRSCIHTNQQKEIQAAYRKNENFTDFDTLKMLKKPNTALSHCRPKKRVFNESQDIEHLNTDTIPLTKMILPIRDSY